MTWLPKWLQRTKDEKVEIIKPSRFPKVTANKQELFEWFEETYHFYLAKGWDTSKLVNPYCGDYLYNNAYAGVGGHVDGALLEAWKLFREKHPELWEASKKNQQKEGVLHLLGYSRVAPRSDFFVDPPNLL